MKQRKWLSRMAATAAAMATLLTGGVVAGTALAADTDEPGLTASKTVTATDKPNVFDVNLSATGRDYAKNKEHALFVLDRTGSVGQSEYDEIANAVRSLGRRLMATGQVQVSVVLFAGGAREKDSAWYDGYENMVTHSTDPADLDRIMVPVSTTTTTTTHNGVFYGSEYGTNWEAAFDGASNVMAHEQLPTDVFFFSDGHPNTWAGDSDAVKEEEAYSRALSRAKEFAASYGDHIQNFTSIGLQRDNQDLSKLEHLSKDVFGAKAKIEFASDGGKVGSDLEANVESELMDGGFAKDVTLTDQLSGNVKPVSTDTKGRPGLSVRMSTDGKTPVALAEGKDYEYAYSNNRMSVKLLNQLKGSQTVTVMIPVKPTDKVLQQAVQGQTGPDVGDPNTGDLSAGKHGWYSNTGTNTVTHVSPNTGSTGTSTLPKPVIPVQVAKLLYDKNATKATGDMSKSTVTAPAGSEQTIVANGFTNEGYTFQGWNTQADGKGKTYSKGDKLTLPAGTTVLYAQWKRIPASIHYDPNGGTGTTDDTKGGQGDTTTLTPNGFSKECWLFDSWNTRKDGKGTKYTDKQAVTLKGDITLYAQWKRDPACKADLVYDKNSPDATGETAGHTGWKGDQATIAANGFTNEGYTFQGWNTQADGKGMTYQKGDKLTLPAGTTVLYAQWKRIPGTLTWVKTDKDSGEVLAGSEWTLTPKDGQPTAITDNGELDQAGEDGAFKLTGLDWGEYELMETKAPEGHDPISAPITVTIDAKHTTVNIGDVSNAKTPAKVTYDPNGGEGQTPGYDGHVGDTPEASENKFTNKDECKEFAGWNTQKDGKGKTYQKGDQLDPLTGTTILYAQWKAKDGCPAAPAALQELGKTGAGITPIAIGMAAATLLGACLMILRRQRHARHA
ncbi:InlB B-repeat-containing protein [Bifidobacterium breve]|uniref:InlB B-repeat-containing protein n=1 Tax=Bifidobacterium breve TaxID=1685 RepID=UPI0003083DE7|nr:InlB B-repeat-containing protein [Bifidobacterium breve]OPG86917.1 cell surface protein [Bifidobacterium breve]